MRRAQECEENGQESGALAADGGRQQLSTGVPGLDAVLRGGLPQYAVVVVAGEPGTGKTILSQQILFNNVDDGKRAVYLTTVSDSPMKVARYQMQFRFFDASKFGTSVVYLDVGQIIRSQGLRQSLGVITDSLRELQPTIVAVDSFRAIHDLAPSALEMREFAYDISVEIAAMQSTALLVGEYSLSDAPVLPEFAIADGIIWLYSEIGDTQLSRYLRVLKMRGVDHVTSPQNFAITRNGVEVFATEGLVPAKIAAYGEHMTATGLPELDTLLHGGIPRGAPMLVTGGPGSGKTTLCMQYLYEGATQYGERGIYFSYEEQPEQIVANARAFGWDLQRLIDEGRLRIFQTPRPDINPSEQLLRMHTAILDFKPHRAVIDSLTMMMTRMTNPDLIRSFVYNMVAILKDAGCTALITSDPPVGSEAISRFGVEESIIDGVIVLRVIRLGRARQRSIEVYKLRGVNHATGENVMKITPRGIEIFPRVEEVLA